MIIALNGKILETTQPAGPEIYAFNFYSALFNQQRNHKFIVYHKKKVENSFLSRLQKNYPFVTFKQVSSTLSWTHNALKKQIITDKPDYYFSPEHTLPLFLPPTISTVIMVHGLEIITNKQMSKTNLKFWLQWFLLIQSCKSAKQVIVPSEYTKNKLLKNNILPDEKKIRVLPEGVSQDYLKTYSQDQINEVKSFFGISREYLLFNSTLQPRKNVEGLLKAFEKVHQSYPDLCLVLAGKKGWDYEIIFETIKQLNLSEHVKYLDWVEQDKLPMLYAGAKGFVNFSFEEGFSLTLAQAMASGIPCAVSDIPTHRVLGKEFVFYANPNNTEDIANTIIKLLNNSSEENLINAKPSAKQYTWENTADMFISLLEQLQKRS